MAPRGRVLLLTTSLALMAALSEPRAATVLRDGLSPFRAQIDVMRALPLTSRDTPVAHPRARKAFPCRPLKDRGRRGLCGSARPWPFS